MKIINHGTKKEEKKNVIRFTCINCGCVFDVNDDEYYSDYRLNVVSNLINVYANCPDCHKMCNKQHNIVSETETIYKGTDICGEIGKVYCKETTLRDLQLENMAMQGKVVNDC